jgi:hypothetical protein
MKLWQNTFLKEEKCSKSPVKPADVPFLKLRARPCVLYAQRIKKSGPSPAAPVHQEHDQVCSCGEHREETCEGGLLTDELAMTIVSLCERIQNEKDPENVLALMNAVKTGTEALQILCQL